MTTLQLPNGYHYLVRTTALHRRKPHSKCAYARVSDWIAQAGPTIAWGRTRREAITNLRTAAEGVS
jgi:hypothetical protein